MIYLSWNIQAVSYTYQRVTVVTNKALGKILLQLELQTLTFIESWLMIVSVVVWIELTFQYFNPVHKIIGEITN